MDNITFYPFTLNTTLTSVNSEFLHPIYFQSGMFIMCTCIPVGKNCSQGHSRTSAIVTIVTHRCAGNIPTDKQKIEMILKSYSSFAAQNNVSFSDVYILDYCAHFYRI